MRIFTSTLAMRHEYLFIWFCIYFHMVTFASVSHKTKIKKITIHHSGTF